MPTLAAMAGRRQWMRLGTAWLASGLAMAGRAQAQSLRPQRMRMRMLVLGISPLGRVGADGKPQGMFVDLAQLLAQESGIAIDTVLVPYPRAMAMMAAGEADLLLSLPNSRMEKLARLLVLVMKVHVIAIGRAGSRYVSLADLEGKVVGHIRSAEYGAAFQDNAAIRKYETSSNEQSVRMLLEKRYDAVIGVREALFYALREMGQPREALGPSLPLWQREINLYISLRSNEQAAAALLTRAMDNLRASGGFKQLWDRYLGGLPRD